MACTRSFPLARAVAPALTAAFVFLIARRHGLSPAYAICATAAAAPARAVLRRRVHARRVSRADRLDVVRGGGVVGAGQLGRSTLDPERVDHRGVPGRGVPGLADLARPVAAGAGRAASCARICRRASAVCICRDRAAAAARDRVDAFLGSLGLAGDRARRAAPCCIRRSSSLGWLLPLLGGHRRGWRRWRIRARASASRCCSSSRCRC